MSDFLSRITEKMYAQNERLYNAIVSGDKETVFFAVKNGGDINGYPNEKKELSCFGLAVQRRDFEITCLLISLGANVSAQISENLQHDTPLMRAALHGHLPIFEELFVRGADLHHKHPYNGETALTMALREAGMKHNGKVQKGNCAKIAVRLAMAGASIDVAKISKYIQYIPEEEIRLFFEAQIQNAGTEQNDTVQLPKKTFKSFVKSLFSPKMKETVCQIDERTKEEKEFAKVLQLNDVARAEEMKAQMKEDFASFICQKNTLEHTFLHKAAALGYKEMTDFLIQQGLDVNAPDRQGFTPLYYANNWGNKAVCTVLLNAGAKLTVAHNGEQVCQVKNKNGAFYEAEISDDVKNELKNIIDNEYTAFSKEELKKMIGTPEGLKTLYAAKGLISVAQRLTPQERMKLRVDLFYHKIASKEDLKELDVFISQANQKENQNRRDTRVNAIKIADQKTQARLNDVKENQKD